MKKTLAKLLLDPRVEEISDESRRSRGGQHDGYWVYLKPGFIRWMHEVHCVHEWNMRDLLQGMKEIRPCACDDCLKELVKQKATKRHTVTVDELFDNPTGWLVRK